MGLSWGRVVYEVEGVVGWIEEYVGLKGEELFFKMLSN